MRQERSAITGRYVKKGTAKRRPNTTVVENNRPRRRRVVRKRK